MIKIQILLVRRQVGSAPFRMLLEQLLRPNPGLAILPQRQKKDIPILLRIQSPSHIDGNQ